MTMDRKKFLRTAQLQAEELDAWIEAGWLVPHRAANVLEFAEIDVARVQFVRDLRRGMGVNDEGVSVILDLVDQIHGLRSVLGEILSGLNMQSEADRYRLAARVRDERSKRNTAPSHSGTSA
jgi:chaperone modulatory protein CbpM